MSDEESPKRQLTIGKLEARLAELKGISSKSKPAAKKPKKSIAASDKDKAERKEKTSTKSSDKSAKPKKAKKATPSIQELLAFATANKLPANIPAVELTKKYKAVHG